MNFEERRLSKKHFQSEMELMAALRFDDQDLEMNRAGRLSDKQRQRLVVDRDSWRIYLWLAIFAFPIGTLFAFVDGIRRNDTACSRIGIVALIWVAIIGVIIYVWFNKRDVEHDLKTGVVSVVKGSAKTFDRGIFRGNTTPRYGLQIQDSYWKGISPSLFNTLRRGETYAIYYAPRTKKILSAEWLRE